MTGLVDYLPEHVDPNCGVYMIRNMRNGKKYIGSTKDARQREKNHFEELRANRHHCDHLQNAWNLEDDTDVFQFVMFIYCKKEDLLAMEQSCFDVMKPEYNSSLIAGRPEHTAAVRAKMSAKKLGKPSPRKGVKSSPEAVQKMRESKLGKPSPKKGKPSGVTAWNKGMHLTPAQKENLSVKCSGWSHTDAAKEKISKSSKGRSPWNKGIPGARHQQAAKDKISAANSISLTNYYKSDKGKAQAANHSIKMKTKSIEMWSRESYRAAHAAGLPRGVCHPMSKFTADDIRYIRSSSEKACDIAKRYNVNKSTIGKIRSGKTYASVK